MQKIIEIQNCNFEDENSGFIKLKNIFWTVQNNQNWVIIGSCDSAKEFFIKSLISKKNDFFCNKEKIKIKYLSFKSAVDIIKEERKNEEDTTVQTFLKLNNVKTQNFLTHYNLLEELNLNHLLTNQIQKLSTGEIRKTLFVKAFLEENDIIFLESPFYGLDIKSKNNAISFLNKFLQEKKENQSLPIIILSLEQCQDIPDVFDYVLEFTKDKISFCGAKEQYLQKNVDNKNPSTINFQKIDMDRLIKEFYTKENMKEEKEIIVQMEKINIGWNEKLVLKDFSWTVNQKENWLILGPNGSGKTTLLELITGDNKQVFCNNVQIFGKRRGLGETIWDIKKQIGIVSYKIHIEHSMINNLPVLSVVLSGFKDTIGVYEKINEREIQIAYEWLKLVGLETREKLNFNELPYGEQRLVLILRAIIKLPKILILDEPCHGLDKNQKTKVLYLLEEIGKRKITTMLHVTHDESEILKCENNILELCPDQEILYKIKKT